MLQRLDKILSEAGVASRKELKTILRAGRVQVDGRIVRDGAEKFEAESVQILLDGQSVRTAGRLCLMLHKPAGYVTSTEDPRDLTVMELLPEPYRSMKLFPVGRLDKQTEGLLLLTNDGELCHKLTAPKHGTQKCYYAEHEGTATEQDIQAFASGLTLRDGTVCRPAILEPLGEGKSRVIVTEGKYHQVRRMMASRSMTVLYLRREREGALQLGDLRPGQLRELTPREIAVLEFGENAEI